MTMSRAGNLGERMPSHRMSQPTATRGSIGGVSGTQRRYPYIVPSLLALLTLEIFGCKDQFRCGIRSGDAILQCDLPGEICICDTHRCAVASATDICGSGLRYTRRQLGDLDNACVPFESRWRSVAGANLCPGEEGLDVVCGTSGADQKPVSCSAGSMCLCHAPFRCVSRVDIARCASGFVYASTGHCVGLPAQGGCELSWPDGSCIAKPFEASVEQMLLGDNRTLCKDPRPAESLCGTAGAGPMGAPSACAAGETCVCGGPTTRPFHCVRPVFGERCANGFAWSYSGLCADPDLTIAHHRYFSTDATGVCPENTNEPRECGFMDNNTLKWCDQGDACFCKTGRCAFRVPHEECDGGWAYRADGRCVEEMVSTSTCASGRMWPNNGGCIGQDVAKAVEDEIKLTAVACDGP